MSSSCGPALDDAPLVEHDDAVGGADGRQPVRDDDRRPPLHHRLERALEARLGVRVDARRRLVEDEERRVAVERAREREELPLARAEVRAALVDLRVEPRRRARWNSSSAPTRAQRLLRPCARSGVGSLIATFESTVPANRKTSCGTTEKFSRSACRS